MKDPKLGEVDITALLGAWEKGDINALNQVIALIYHDLRRTARYYLRDRTPNGTLQATALVHEVYQRLAGAKELVFENRTHFFNCACLIMRQVLVKYARRHGAKSGGEYIRLRYSDEENLFDEFGTPDPDTLLAVDRALSLLGELDPRRHRIIELRFFVGLSMEEISRVLDISPRTVRREWLTARRWLARELGRRNPRGRGTVKE